MTTMTLKDKLFKLYDERNLLKKLVKLDGVRYAYLNWRIAEIKMIVNVMYGPHVY